MHAHCCSRKAWIPARVYYSQSAGLFDCFTAVTVGLSPEIDLSFPVTLH